MIYIVTPKWICTGGVELCHQLCDALNNFEIECTLCYISARPEDIITSAVLEPYAEYNVKTRVGIPNENITSDDYLVVTEGFIGIKGGFDDDHIIIWWMSVDNQKYVGVGREYLKKIKYHLVQSWYAREYLLNSCNIFESNIYNLSDYVNSSYLNSNRRSLRKNTILFNPRKGFETVKELFAIPNNLIWQGIFGFDRYQIIDIMSHAKVYIDFGKHPGKDRIPREAVLSGAIVITGENGAAKNDVDIPIPGEYKFSEPYNYFDIMNMIVHCVTEYDERKQHFELYRNRTMNEFRIFEEDAFSFFSMLLNIKHDVTMHDVVDECEDLLKQREYQKVLKLAVMFRLSIQNEDAKMLYMEAQARFGMKRYNEAIYCCRRGLGINDDYYPLYMVMSEAHLELGDSYRAINCAQQALVTSYRSGESDSIKIWCEEIMKIAERRMKCEN